MLIQNGISKMDIYVIKNKIWYYYTVQCSSVAQLCQTLCNPMDCSMPGFTNSHSLLKLMSTELMLPSNRLILCYPLLFLPSIFPSIRELPKELVLHIRWPKYWSFSFSISPSNEHPGLISFRMDSLDLLAVQDFQEASPTLLFKSINSSAFSFLYSPTHIHTWLLEKP